MFALEHKLRMGEGRGMVLQGGPEGKVKGNFEREYGFL